MGNIQGTLFRKALNGYNKNDVNDYIENMSLRAKKREDELEAKISKLEKALEETEKRAETAEKRDFSEEAAAYEKKISEFEQKIDECEKITEAKSEYIEKLESSLEQKDAEISKYSARLSDNEKSIKEAVELSDKAKQYDNLSRRLGEIMLNAGNAAEKIVSDANDKASALLADASKKRDHCLEVLKKYTEKYCDKLGEVTVASAQERLDRIHSEMAEFEASITRSVMNARRQNGSVREYIEDLRHSLDTSLDSILNGSDSEQKSASADTAAPKGNEPSDASVDEMLESAVNDILSQISAELGDLDSSYNTHKD